MTNQDSLSVTSSSSQSHQEDSRRLGSRSRRNKTSGNISLRNRSHEEDDSGLNSSTEQSESENNLYQFPEESAKEDESHEMKEQYLLQKHDSESIVNANEHLLKNGMKQSMKEETEKISQVRRKEDYSDETKDYEGGNNSNDIPGKDEDGEGYSRELTKVHTNSITLMEEKENTQTASKEKRNSSSGASSLSDDEDEVHDDSKVTLHELSQEFSEITTQNYQKSTQAEVNADESSNKASTQLCKPKRQEEQQPLPSSLGEQSHQHRCQEHHHKDRKPAQAFYSNDKNRKSRKDEGDDYEEDDQVEEPVKMRRQEASLLLRQQESSEEQEERELQEYAEKIRQRILGRRRCDQDVVQEHHRRKGDVNQGSVFVSSADEVESALQVWENEKREFEESSRYRHHQQSSFLFRTGSLSSPSPPLVPPHHQSSLLSSHHASGRVSLLIHPSRIQEENQGEVEEAQQECQFNQVFIQRHHHLHEEGNQRQSSRSGRPSNLSCTSSPVPPVLPHKHQLNNNQRQDSSTGFSTSSPSLVRRQPESGDQAVPRLVHLDIQEETTTPKITMESSRNEGSLNTNDSTMKKGLLWQMKDGSFFFNRWKERYFILTQDYLTCFKKKTSSLRKKKLGSIALSSFMGSYSYKLKLLDIEDISWKCCSDCGSSSGSKSSAARRFLLPRSMTMGGKSRDNDVRQLTKRSKSSDPAANVVSQLQQQSVSLSLGGGSSTDIEVIEHNNRSYSTTEGVSLSDAASSRSSSRKRSTFRGNGREVISITMSKGGENKKKGSTSQIDLWTDSEPELNEWMFILKEAVDHSKGRRKAFIKKSQTLCMPDPSLQPFALASYWATSR